MNRRSDYLLNNLLQLAHTLKQRGGMGHAEAAENAVAEIGQTRTASQHTSDMVEAVKAFMPLWGNTGLGR